MEMPIFVTGNSQKAAYLSRQLGINLAHQAVDLDEIQSTSVQAIVEHKLRQAFSIVGKPVLLEDVALGYDALGDMPGPFIKWFLDSAGAEACCRMLDGFDTRRAAITCVYGFYDGVSMKLFEKVTRGLIADHPAGDNGFGFDRIFINDGYTMTRAEMSQAENEETYASIMKPFAEVRGFLEELRG